MSSTVCEQDVVCAIYVNESRGAVQLSTGAAYREPFASGGCNSCLVSCADPAARGLARVMSHDGRLVACSSSNSARVRREVQVALVSGGVSGGAVRE